MSGCAELAALRLQATRRLSRYRKLYLSVGSVGPFSQFSPVVEFIETVDINCLRQFPAYKIEKIMWLYDCCVENDSKPKASAEEPFFGVHVTLVRKRTQNASRPF